MALSDSSWTAMYRNTGTGGQVWVGTALAARIMNAKGLWNNNAWFDYADRYAAISQGQTDPFGYTVSSENSNHPPSGLIARMYNQYRTQYGCMGTGHDPQGNLQYSCGANSVNCATIVLIICYRYFSKEYPIRNIVLRNLTGLSSKSSSLLLFKSNQPTKFSG